MPVQVALHADVGASPEAAAAEDERRLLESVTSASIACGFHAGDPSVMRRAVRLAVRANVAIGAHPSFPDLAGFGRREMEIEPQAISDLVLYQVGALQAMLRAEGVRLQHVKPHGALYNMAARRRDIAEAVATSVASLGELIAIVGLPGSELVRAARGLGLPAAEEGFADRGYEADGSLSARDRPGAVIRDPRLVAERAVEMVRNG